MKKAYIILCFTLVSAISFSYEASKDSVKIYYRKVFKAEEAIVNGNIQSASLIYKEAFNVKTPFERDLKNAFCVELELNNDTSLIKAYLQKILSLTGKSLNDFLKSKDSKFNKRISWMRAELQSHVLWNEIKDMQAETLNFNTKLIDELNEILKNDQSIRNECFKKYKGYYDNPISRRIIMNQDSINMVRIINLYKHNVINETTVGVKCLQSIYIVDLHNGAWERDTLHDLLKNEVLLGNFDARKYAYLEDRRLSTICHNKINNEKCNYESFYGTDDAIIMNGILFTSIFEPARRKEVSLNRQSIFLEDFESYIKKQNWQFTQDKYNFEGYKIFSGMNKKIIDDLIKANKKSKYGFVIRRKDATDIK